MTMPDWHYNRCDLESTTLTWLPNPTIIWLAGSSLVCNTSSKKHSGIFIVCDHYCFHHVSKHTGGNKYLLLRYTPHHWCFWFENITMKGMEVYWGFMYLEKDYDRVGKEVIWIMLRMYAVRWSLFRAKLYFYFDLKACVQRGERGEDSSS